MSPIEVGKIPRTYSYMKENQVKTAHMANYLTFKKMRIRYSTSLLSQVQRHSRAFPEATNSRYREECEDRQWV